MASVYRVDIALGGIGSQSEDCRDVQRVSAAYRFDFVEDPVLSQEVEAGLLAAQDSSEPHPADRAVVMGGLLGDQQMGVGRARPPAGSVVEVALDGLVGEVVEGTGLALDGEPAVGQIGILQGKRLKVHRSERMMAGQHRQNPSRIR